MHIIRVPLVLAVVALLALPTARAAAQNLDAPAPLGTSVNSPEASGIVDLHRLNGPIVLDGFSGEAAWADVPALGLTMYEPTFRGASPRQIEVRVAYDADAIYMSARFYHDDPEEIRAFSLTRDRWSGDDGFGILLDTFNDNENALRFVGLPLGTRMDMSVSGDGQQATGPGSGGPRTISWNTFWDLKTQITDEGWFGEMRIPFSSLRFETESDGSVVMGMMAYAYEPAAGTRWTYPAIPPRFPYTQVSSWQDVRLRDVQPQNPVYVTPYALTGAALRTELSPAQDAFVGISDQSIEIGADVKFSPTPYLTLDLTANTDFAAVEADQQQVNLTRFSLFFDEKRPFFQERAGIFAFATGADRGTLFYSRRIGLADGAPVRILGGARLVGRIGSWDLGLINMQTASASGLPSENFGVLRLRRRVLNTSSFVGGMATTRFGNDGEYNVTYGLDGQFKLLGDEYVTLKWLQTFQDLGELGPVPDGIDAGRLVVDWTRRRVQGFSHQQAVTWSGAGYNPGVGFESRTDFLRAQSDWGYQWFPGAESALRRVWLGATNNMWRRNADGGVDTGEFQPFLQFETKPGNVLRFATRTTYEDVIEDFELSDEASIPVGSYWASEAELQFFSSRGATIRPNVTLTAGDFFDGSRVGVTTDLTWAVNEYVQFGGGWEWNRIRFDERAQAFDANLIRLRAEGAVNTHLSMNAFVQYNSLSGQAATNARFRYNFSEGQDLWLVWNEGLNFDRVVLGLPRRPFEEARTLTLKYSHTVVF